MTINDPAATPDPVRTRPHYVDRYVGRKVRERRVALGMTREELAGLAGISRGQLDACERGVGDVPAGRLYWIAEALGAEVGCFFEGLGGERPAGGGPAPRDRPAPGREPAVVPAATGRGVAPHFPLGDFLAAMDEEEPALPAAPVRRPLAAALVALNVVAVGLVLAASPTARHHEAEAQRRVVVVPIPAPWLARAPDAEPPARLVARELETPAAAGKDPGRLARLIARDSG